MTSPVEIRHIEQEAEIQELFLFRAEIDVFPGYPTLPDNNFFLEVEMLMHDSKSNKVPEALDPKNPAPKPTGSRSVAHLKYEINSISKGIHEYIQGNFIENYYSILNMCIHTVTTGNLFIFIFYLWGNERWDPSPEPQPTPADKLTFSPYYFYFLFGGK